MAQKTTVEFIDDIDGTTAERTFTFAVDGVNYEIDLSTNNIAQFKQAIGGYIESARKTKPGRSRRAGAARPQVDREQTTAIRQWARQNGYTVNDRGCIPLKVQEALAQTHQSSAQPASAVA